MNILAIFLKCAIIKDNLVKRVKMSKNLPCPYCEKEIGISEEQCPFCYADFEAGELEYALKKNLADKFKPKVVYKNLDKNLDKITTKTQKQEFHKQEFQKQENNKFKKNILQYFTRVVLIFLFHIFYLAGFGRFILAVVLLILPFLGIAFVEEILNEELNLSDDEYFDYFLYYWIFVSLVLPMRLKKLHFKLHKLIITFIIIAIFYIFMQDYA